MGDSGSSQEKDLSYEETVRFWDKIFEDTDTDFDHQESFSIEEIEDCLDWLVDESKSVIDFGCGNGKLLLRVLARGAERGVGIDISPEAIKKAKTLSEINGCKARTKFIEGGLKILTNFEKDEFDAGILSNVVDNLKPKDAERLLQEIIRIVKPGGKIFLKLNDHIDPENLEERGAEEIEDDFYKEDTGLYLWNLSDEDVRELLEKESFKIESRVDVEFKEEGQVNRLYYLTTI
ncbi:MAG: class I SAM-dependent methyltransferase [Candidatus Natronoplasma sp.]